MTHREVQLAGPSTRAILEMKLERALYPGHPEYKPWYSEQTPLSFSKTHNSCGNSSNIPNATRVCHNSHIEIQGHPGKCIRTGY